MKKQYVQFSKRLATLVAVSWVCFRVLGMVFVLLKPEISTAVTSMLTGVDDALIVSIGFYTGNSVAEKGIVNYFKAKTSNGTDEETENG